MNPTGRIVLLILSTFLAAFPALADKLDAAGFEVVEIKPIDHDMLAGVLTAIEQPPACSLPSEIASVTDPGDYKPAAAEGFASTLSNDYLRPELASKGFQQRTFKPLWC